MKLLHVINDLNVGGAQKIVHDLILIQKNNPRIEVTCFVFKRTNSKIEQSLIGNGINIVIANKSFISISTLKHLIQQMRMADVVHVHLFPSNYIVAIANFIARKKLVFTEHSTHNRRREHRLLRSIEQFIYSRFNRVSCISEATADNLTKWIGAKIANPRLITIANGIDLERFSGVPKAKSVDIFRRPGIPVIMVSRFTDSKDHPTVIRALSLIEDKDVFAVFVGDGERRKELESLVKELNLENRVVILGTREDIPQLIRSAYIGIQSSNWEGFGLTAVEIMASGIPLIASDVKGLKDVVKDAGLLFSHENEYELADCIKKILYDKNLYARLQKKGLEKAKEYSIINTANKYDTMYHNLLNR